MNSLNVHFAYGNVRQQQENESRVQMPLTALVKSQGTAGMCWRISSTCAMFTEFYNMLTWKLLATK
jgi:hypothetical protein